MTNSRITNFSTRKGKAIYNVSENKICAKFQCLGGIVQESMVHSLYAHFKRWGKNELFWKILDEIKQKKLAEFKIVFIDSTTVKLHKHGSRTLKTMVLKALGRMLREKAQRYMQSRENNVLFRYA